jgi:hypothetical protein
MNEGDAVYVLLQDEDYGNYAIRAVCSTLDLAMSRADVEGGDWTCPLGSEGTYWWHRDWRIEKHRIETGPPSAPARPTSHATTDATPPTSSPPTVPPSP